MPITDLPEGVKSVEVLRLEPGDWLVCRSDKPLPPDSRERIKAELEHYFNWPHVIVSGPEFSLSVVRKGDANGLHAMPAAEGT